MSLTKQEVHRFILDGDETVNTAVQLLGKLPNGWKLIQLAYHPGEGNAVGHWHAVVMGPEDVVR